MNVWLFLTLKMVAMVTSVTSTPDPICYCMIEELTKLRMPVHVEHIKGDNSYLIAEQLGVIWKYSPSTDAKHKLTPYLDISDKVVCEPKLFEERGLLGFAVHPNFATNTKLYTYSVRLYDNTDHVVITEVTDGHVQEEHVLLAIEQPGNKRNGGQLLFGPDGYLYIFVGDGGPHQDHKTDAQNGDNLLGKILRIDVDKTGVADYRPRFYGIPETNPLQPGWRPEIYALGARNMWRCSIDKGDKNGAGGGRIFCGDLGSSIADELNIIKKGGNYGWHFREGLTCLNPSRCGTVENEVLPIYAFNRSTSPINAIVGGPVYRGSSFPDIAGQLIYGDFVTADLFRLKEESNDKWTPKTFPTCDHKTCGCNARAYRSSNLISFGQTTEGEVMLLMTDDLNPTAHRGSLLRLVPPLGNVPVLCCGCRQHINPWIIFTAAIVFYLSIH